MRNTWLAAVAALVALGAAHAATQDPMVVPTLPSPPLLPGEVFQTTANGCGAIFSPRSDSAANVKAADWHGACVAGLLQGTQTQQGRDSQGVSATIVAEFAFGREIEMTKTIAGEDFKRLFRYSLQGLSSEPSGVNLDNLAAQDWSVLRNGMGWTIQDENNDAPLILISIAPCYHDQARYPKCTKENYKKGTDDVPLVIRSSAADLTSEGCADRIAVSSCGEVLARILAEVAPRFAKLKADSAAWKAQVNALYQNYVADYNRAQAAITAAAAARQRAAEREARQAEAQFQSGLKTMNAGQLFAKADELRRAGQQDKAMQTLRALMSRFPNSPLTPMAAQQLSGMSGGGGSTGASAQYNGGGSASAGGGSSGMCKAKYAEDERIVAGENPGGDGGTLRTYQNVLYIVQRRLNVLDSYCRGEPEYNQRAATQRVYDTALKNCAAVSSTGSCPGPVPPPRK